MKIVKRDKYYKMEEHHSNNGNNDNNSNSEEISISIEETIDPMTNKTVYNNWTKSNTDTIRHWKTSVSKASFVYDVVLEKYKTIVDKTLVWAFILGTISTILAAISSAILVVDKDLVWVGVGFNISIFILNGVVTILNGRVKIYKWGELVTNLSTYIEKLDSFYAEISSELVLPDKLRNDAVDFIKKQDNTYLNIMRQSPDIYTSDYTNANKKYKDFIEDNTLNYKFAQKYNSNDAVIDIV